MNPLFLYACVFSLLAFTMVSLLAKRHALQGYRVTRLALLLLLAIPLLLFLPKIHCLPSNPSVFRVTEAANQSTPYWLVALWLSGAVICLVRLIFSIVQLASWKRNSQSIDNPGLLAMLRECQQQQGYARPIELRAHRAKTSPVASGIFQAMIFLPRDWSEWSPMTMRAVLLHEIGHHRSRDPLWRLLSLICTSLHWYNPFVTWLSKQLQLQSEVACDASVINSGFQQEQYAHILCDLASAAPYSAMAMASPSGLEMRVRQLGTKQKPAKRWGLYSVMIVLLAAAIAVSILRPAHDPGAPLPPTSEDTQLRLNADPFPQD